MNPRFIPSIWTFLLPAQFFCGIAPIVVAGLISAAGSIGGALLGKSKAPQAAPPIDLGAEQKKAIANNISNQDDIESLIARANTFNQDQNISLMEKAMPGYGELSKKFTKQANELLTNPYELPADVEQNIARLAAERGISAGTKGEFNDFSLLRDFGINSLQYGAGRIGQAQSITGMLASLAPKVNPLSPMSFYVTPQMSADVAAGNRSNQQAANNAGAAAGNYNQANTWGAIAQGIGTVAGAWAGSQGNGNLVQPDTTYQGGTSGYYSPPLGGNSSSAAYVRGN